MTALIVLAVLVCAVWLSHLLNARIRLARLEHSVHVHVLHEKEKRTMATLSDINDRLTKLEADVANIPAQQPPQPTPAATEADLDIVGARLDAIDAAVLAKSQPAPAG